MHYLPKRITRAAVIVAATTSTFLITGCGAEASPPQMTTCGVIGDASGSATELLTRARPAIEKFVADKRCGTVQVVAITANSVGETCTARTLDLVGAIRAHPSNTAAWEKEYRTDQVPRVSSTTNKLAQCVAQRGTSGGSDVFGALVELDRLVDPVHVMLVSDLVHNVGVDLSSVSLATPQERAQVRAQVEASGLVPPMTGWSLDVVGAAFGTTVQGPGVVDPAVM